VGSPLAQSLVAMQSGAVATRHYLQWQGKLQEELSRAAVIEEQLRSEQRKLAAGPRLRRSSQANCSMSSVTTESSAQTSPGARSLSEQGRIKTKHKSSACQASKSPKQESGTFSLCADDIRHRRTSRPKMGAQLNASPSPLSPRRDVAFDFSEPVWHMMAVATAASTSTSSTAPGRSYDGQAGHHQEDNGQHEGETSATCQRSRSLSFVLGRNLLRTACETANHVEALQEADDTPEVNGEGSNLAPGYESNDGCSKLTGSGSAASTSCPEDEIVEGRQRRLSSVFNAAMAQVPPSIQAMHPDRASGGLALLKKAREGIKMHDADFDDGVTTVKRLFLDSIPANCVEVGEIKLVVQPDLLKRFLQRLESSEACVEATWHGTRAEHVENILDNGLAPSLCHTGAYGRGAYVGTHAGVAHQYADPGPQGWRHMCLTLVIVGKEITKGHQGMQSQVTSMDRLRNPMQYCFVDEDRIYVSHILTYRVTNTLGCRIGASFEDPFQRELSLAVTRAAQTTNSGGKR